jgi:hypothetical protein
MVSYSPAIRATHADQTPARPSRRPQHAHRSNHRLRLLYCLDAIHGTGLFSSLILSRTTSQFSQTPVRDPRV